jgi:preprotein translocase subunit SecG
MFTVLAILWFVIWALVLVDLFRRDWSIGVKIAWAIGILILPIVGVIAYLIVRPPSSADVHGVIDSTQGESAQERGRDRHPV